LKQIDSQNIRPLMEEKQMFLDTFNQNTLGEPDSSDVEPDETRNFFKRDSGMELSIGEKIYVTSGELQ